MIHFFLTRAFPAACGNSFKAQRQNTPEPVPPALSLPGRALIYRACWNISFPSKNRFGILGCHGSKNPSSTVLNEGVCVKHNHEGRLPRTVSHSAGVRTCPGFCEKPGRWKFLFPSCAQGPISAQPQAQSPWCSNAQELGLRSGSTVINTRWAY